MVHCAITAVLLRMIVVDNWWLLHWNLAFWIRLTMKSVWIKVLLWNVWLLFVTHLLIKHCASFFSSEKFLLSPIKNNSFGVVFFRPYSLSTTVPERSQNIVFVFFFVFTAFLSKICMTLICGNSGAKALFWLVPHIEGEKNIFKCWRRPMILHQWRLQTPCYFNTEPLFI